ncbi:MAG: hypothetical protein IK079_04330 [Desulfovibrio sp.]|nr:hypothetical protein [Desulfovibrio sp.]
MVQEKQIFEGRLWFAPFEEVPGHKQKDGDEEATEYSPGAGDQLRGERNVPPEDTN